MKNDARTLSQRLVGKFEQKGPDECWPWIAAADKTGRGRISYQGKALLSTHAVLIADGHPRPEAPADNALHLPKCSPDCSNPKHLRWGTQQENMADRVIAGTTSREGIIFNKSVLTEQDVRDIRSSTMTLKDLAELYEVSSRSIWDIKKRKSWKWVSDDPTPSD
jgi:hypothetical protein